MVGMTWARGAIFYGSDLGKNLMMAAGCSNAMGTAIPPLIIGTFVQVSACIVCISVPFVVRPCGAQIVNMPIVRATITIQDPKCDMTSTTQALVHIYKTRGLDGLWHGVSAGILKTVPKYVTAVAVKDYMEDYLPRAQPGDKRGSTMRSAIKSICAGVAGAALTNPLDVLRNE